MVQIKQKGVYGVENPLPSFLGGIDTHIYMYIYVYIYAHVNKSYIYI